MSNLEFFKKQAKLLLKDWQTQIKKVEDDGFIFFEYHPKFYDVADLFSYYEFSDEDEQDIKLARAEHLIAQMVGFKKWNDLIAASEKELELAKILLKRFKNASVIQDWEDALMLSGVAEYGIDAVLDYAKQYYQRKETSEEQFSDFEDKVTLLEGQERKKTIIKFLDGAGEFTPATRVKCIHCGNSFLLKESRVIRYDGDKTCMLMCKNYPSCDGSFLDFKSLDFVEDYKEYGHVPFDYDMDQGYVDEYE